MGVELVGFKERKTSVSETRLGKEKRGGGTFGQFILDEFIRITADLKQSIKSFYSVKTSTIIADLP